MSLTPEQIEAGFTLSPSQGVKILAIAELLRTGEIDFRGHSTDEAKAAREAIIDAGQEIALQVGAE